MQTQSTAELPTARKLRHTGRENNRDRIISASLSLFNRSGVVGMSTNHIAAYAEISPGNLYYHFKNKEEIIRQLFDMMSQQVETYLAKDIDQHPTRFFFQLFELFWRYRFFHRELYQLRRQDPALSRKWRRHFAKSKRLLLKRLQHWQDRGILRDELGQDELNFLITTLLVSSSSFFQIYESPLKQGSMNAITYGVDHLNQAFASGFCPEWKH